MDMQIVCMKTAATRRGEFISSTIALEKIIEFYIAGHFCKNEELKGELIDLIISTKRITYESKIQILKVLLDRHEKKFVDKNKDFHSRLVEVGEHRNVLAHYIIFTDESALDKFRWQGILTFVKVLNTTKFIEFNPTYLDEMEKKSSECATKLRELMKIE